MPKQLLTVIRGVGAAAGIAGAAILGACTSYYKINDPAGNRMYYTKDEPDRERSGAITFTDAKTNAKITLQSSEVLKISEDEFEKATAKPK